MGEQRIDELKRQRDAINNALRTARKKRLTGLMLTNEEREFLKGIGGGRISKGARMCIESMRKSRAAP